MPTTTLGNDRDHLLGLLALRMDFVSREALKEALAAWRVDPSRSLGTVLIDLGLVAPSRAALLETLVDEQLSVRSGLPDDPGTTAVEGSPPASGSGSGFRSSLAVLLGEEPTNLGRDQFGPGPETDEPAATQADADLSPAAPARAEMVTEMATDLGEVDRATPTLAGAPDPWATSATDASRHQLGPATSPAPGAATPGQPIRYTILKHHAKGGLGDVFVALDEELHREVALKEIQERHADRNDSRLRFLIEAEITGGLEHPGIVPVYGLGRYPDGRPYYAMRFIRGDTLRDTIGNFHAADEAPDRDPGERTIALRELLRRFLDVCNAIGYAHSRGVLHRDIKPANVMLGRYGETLVVDWGLAKSVARREIGHDDVEKPLFAASGGGETPTLMGSAMGTPQFMSPEQADGKLDELGPTTDVYSLGATLYNLLAGIPPFVEPAASLVLHKVRLGDFKPPRAVNPRVPAALDAICLKAMALRPADRYPSAHALAVDVEHWLADEPVTAYREPWPVRALRWSKRHRPLVAGLGAVCLTGVVALGVSNVLIARERDRTDLARREADANYDLSRRTIETMLDELAAIDLADVPLMEPVRRRILLKAVEFYKTFVATRGSDPALRLDIGRGQVRLGDVLEGLGDARGAEAAYREGINRLIDLAAATKTDPEVRRSLAAAEFGLGILLKKANRFKQADEMLRRSLADRIKAASMNGKVADDRRQVASTRYQLAALLARQKGRSPEDERLYREALKEQKALLDEPGASPSDLTRRDYARNLNNLAILLRGSDPTAAEASFREAYAIQIALERESPESPTYRWQAARTATSLGGLLAGQGPARLEEAGNLYREALARFRRLAADFPKIPDYRQELAAVENNLALLAEQSARGLAEPARLEIYRETALPAMARSVDAREALVRDFEGRPDYVQSLAVALRHQADMLLLIGQKDEARARIDRALSLQTELVAKHPDARHYDLELARTLDVSANFATDRGDLAASIGLSDRAIAAWKAIVAAEPDDRSRRVELATAYSVRASTFNAMGNSDGVLDAAERLAETLPDDPNEVRRAGRFTARAVALLVNSGAPAPAIEAASKRCVDLLLKAVRLGFSDPAEFDNEAYKPLHGRDDFRRVRQELEARIAATKS